ncbi:MAG: glycosyltransferase [Elusimicrobia bacterium]|nr:glycosyltransferase [Elusimicrobiota bacterium]
MNKREKIAFVLPNLYGGGAEKVALNLCREFIRRNFDVDLLLIKKTGVYLRQAPDNLKIVELKQRDKFLTILFILKHLRLSHFKNDTCNIFWNIAHIKIPRKPLLPVLSLAEYIKREKPSVVISFLHHSNVITILAKMVSNLPVKCIISLRNTFSREKKDPSEIIPLLTNILYNKIDVIDAIIVPSNGVKADFLKVFDIPQEKIKVIHNPICLEEIQKKQKEEITLPDWLNKKERDFSIVLAIGRLVPQKSFEDLIIAFFAVRQKRKAKLIILGEGIERERLEDRIKSLKLEEDVLLPGFVDNPYPYMAKADVFVLASKYEGFSNVILDALACGVSVVSADCPGGLKEISENEKYGKLVPVGDIFAMAQAIEKVLDSPFDSKDLIQKAGEFEIKKIADKYLEVML